MRYLMRQRIFTFTDDFVIKDEDGRERFQVDGRFFAIGNKLSFRDMSDRELVFIEQKLFHWGPTYELHSRGKLAAVVKKELFTFFKCRFDVDVPGPDDLEATGDFLDHEYSIAHLDGRAAAHVSKKWFAFADTYGVEIAGGEDDVLLLATTVVIDLCCHPRGKR